MGRPLIYPKNTKLVPLSVPDTLKEQVRQIAIALAHGRIEEAKKLLSD
jgi:hypothetical protein